MEKRSDGERTILADEIGAHFILDSRFTGRAEEDDLLGWGAELSSQKLYARHAAWRSSPLLP